MTDITVEKLTEKFRDKIIDSFFTFDMQTFVIERSALVEIATFLRDDSELAYLHLSDVTATDWPEREQRFEVIYHLFSFHLSRCIRLKLIASENDKVPTLTGEWDTADWLEREVYDLFGIEFDGHPDLRRILTWEDFDGHPLRKDYPLTYEMPQFSWNKDEPPEVIR